ncbi:lacC, partial [Symbiodinium pilosum]
LHSRRWRGRLSRHEQAGFVGSPLDLAASYSEATWVCCCRSREAWMVWMLGSMWRTLGGDPWLRQRLEGELEACRTRSMSRWSARERPTWVLSWRRFWPWTAC